MTAKVFYIVPEVAVAPSPLNGLQQTATRFPFTYTYYGLDTDMEAPVVSGADVLTHKNNFVREICDESA